MFPSPPHCATSRPPGRSARAQAREESLVVGYPVEGRRREDRVDRLLELQLEQVGHAQLHAPGRASSRAASIIDGDSSTAITLPRGSRSISASVTRPEPQPASSTVSSPDSSSRSQHRSAHRLHDRRHPVIARPVPLAGAYVTFTSL